jgi:hypothetical protein
MRALRIVGTVAVLGVALYLVVVHQWRTMPNAHLALLEPAAAPA